jgi:hypothetical protein
MAKAPATTPVRLTICRCAKCMAVMLTYALLTKRSKPILPVSLVKPLRILLPRTRFLRHRILAVSSSLGLGSTGSAHILLPCAGPYLRFGFGPIIRLQLRLEPLFLPLPRPPPLCMAALPICRIVPPRPVRDSRATSSAAFVVPLLQGQMPRLMTPGPCPSPRAGPFHFQRSPVPANSAGGPG